MNILIHQNNDNKLSSKIISDLKKHNLNIICGDINTLISHLEISDLLILYEHQSTDLLLLKIFHEQNKKVLLIEDGFMCMNDFLNHSYTINKSYYNQKIYFYKHKNIYASSNHPFINTNVLNIIAIRKDGYIEAYSLDLIIALGWHITSYDSILNYI